MGQLEGLNLLLLISSHFTSMCALLDYVPFQQYSSSLSLSERVAVVLTRSSWD